MTDPANAYHSLMLEHAKMATERLRHHDILIARIDESLAKTQAALRHLTNHIRIHTLSSHSLEECEELLSPD